MRRIFKWAGLSLATAAAFILLAFALGNTAPGKATIARLVSGATGHVITIAGLTGRFPDRLRATKLTLNDEGGTWATMEHVALDWSPLQLLSGKIAIDRLAAGNMELQRLPKPSGGAAFNLPFPLEVHALRVDRLDVAGAVAGAPASLSLEGSAAITAQRQNASLLVSGIDSPGRYRFDGKLDSSTIDLRVAGQESSRGLVARLANLPDIGGVAIDGTLQGSRSAAAAHLIVTAGESRTEAQGIVDIQHRSAALAVSASAPAMSPRPDLSWGSIQLKGRLEGPIDRPATTATLDIDQLTAMGTSLAHLSVKAEGDSGTIRLQAMLNGLRVPGPKPDFLGAAPIHATAEIQLTKTDHPIQFSVSHPLISATGNASTSGTFQGEIELPNLSPIAALAGLDLEGRSVLHVTGTSAGGTTRLDASGSLSLTGGTAPLPALIGDDARIELSATTTGANRIDSRFELKGRSAAASGTGNLERGALAFDGKLTLSDLSTVAPTLAGDLNVESRISGPIEDLTATAELSGQVGAVGSPENPFRAKAEVNGLPHKPAGTITADSELAGSPLQLTLVASRDDDSALRVSVEHADWRSTRVQGSLVLPNGSRFPVGQLDLNVAHLEELEPLFGYPISGMLKATLVTAEAGGHARANLQLSARDVALRGALSAGRLEGTGSIIDPLTAPALHAHLNGGANLTGGAAGSVSVDLDGPEEKLGAKLNAVLHSDSGDAHLVSSGIVNAFARLVALSTLQAHWRNQDIRLLRPARLSFDKEVRLDNLQLAFGQGSIQASGRVAPTLELSVAVRNLSPDVIGAVAPGFAADGVIRGDANLAGTLSRPRGKVEVTATGLRMRTKEARALPAATLTATAELTGTRANLRARLISGPKVSLTLDGEVPVSETAPLDLHAVGAFDLTMLDPLLMASGRQAKGKLSLDGHVRGTWHSPQLSGAGRLTDGSIEDLPLGIHIAEMGGLIEAAGNTIRLTRLEGRSGTGTIEAGGSVGFMGSEIPVDMTITARNAQLPASDALTAVSNADLRLHGNALGTLTLGGKVDVLNATIGMPKHLPASVPVLDVRVLGKPAPNRETALSIGLDLNVAARQIIVRGRGLFAELAGSVRVTGTPAAPETTGSFHMVRGNLDLAGQTLTFSKGEIGFNGGNLADPSLDFVAMGSSSSMTGSIEITGTVRSPKVKITSTPELPQDEVLAQLIFHDSVTSLSPLQLGAIASSLGDLTGATSGVTGPMDRLRQELGLEQLSFGSGANNSTTLQVGRYVAPGVYVGAQQGTGTSNSQAKVQVDITKRLKLVGTVGTGTNTTPGATPADSAGTSLGLKYQLEY